LHQALGAPLLLQRSAGNHLVSRWLGSAATSHRLARLRRTAAGTNTYADVDINALSAGECHKYLRYLTEQNQTPPCVLNLGPAGMVEYATGDRQLLEARRAADLPSVMQQLVTQLQADAPEFQRRLISQLTPQHAGLLVQQIAANPNVAGFEAWLLDSAARLLGPQPDKQKQRLDQLNELREASLDAAHHPINIAETPIPGAAAQTADITAMVPGARQTEVKTVRDPIVRPADVMGQIGQGCAKFSGATNANNVVVVYASCAPQFLEGTGGNGSLRLNVGTGAVERKQPNGWGDAGMIWDFAVQQLNAANNLPGKQNVGEIIVRLENAQSFILTRGPNQWQGALT
jgi:hypothetical protein